MAVLDSALGGKVLLPLQFLDRWGHSGQPYFEDCSKGGGGRSKITLVLLSFGWKQQMTIISILVFHVINRSGRLDMHKCDDKQRPMALIGDFANN